MGEPALVLHVGFKPDAAYKTDANGEAKRSAAEAAMKAFKSGSVDALNAALTAHYEACSMGSYDE
jgi:hypothetical protein